MKCGRENIKMKNKYYTQEVKREIVFELEAMSDSEAYINIITVVNGNPEKSAIIKLKKERQVVVQEVFSISPKITLKNIVYLISDWLSQKYNDIKKGDGNEKAF
jgi:hypothetical protein